MHDSYMHATEQKISFMSTGGTKGKVNLQSIKNSFSKYLNSHTRITHA